MNLLPPLIIACLPNPAEVVSTLVALVPALTAQSQVSEGLKSWAMSLQWASFASLVVPLVVGLRRRRLLGTPMWLLLLYIVVSAFVDVADLILYLVTHRFQAPWPVIRSMQILANTHLGLPLLRQIGEILQQVFTLAEYSILVGVFISWPMRPALHRVARWSIPVFIVAGLSLTTFSVASSSGFLVPLDLIFIIAECTILVLLAVLLLLEVNMQSLGAIFQRSEFWFASGVLIYFAGNLLSILFILGKQQVTDEVLYVSILHVFLNIISILLYARAMQCQNPSPSS
jgi:hypothetical protein